MLGKTVSQYPILEKLGGGSSVHRAEDIKQEERCSDCSRVWTSRRHTKQIRFETLALGRLTHEC